MADKIIGLDLSKRDGFNKAITGRVGDKNNTYLFRLFNNGVLFDLTKATQIALLGLTPTGYYVDAVGFPQSDGTIKVDIPSAFNAEIGYFQRCFIRVVTTDEEILSTQDLIYYSYGNADISAGGGKDYIGRVEELIKELNEAAENFTNGLTDKYNKALADLQDLTDRMDALEAGGALMKTEAEKLYMKKSSLAMGADDWNTYQEIGTYGITTGTGANAPIDSSGTLLVQGYGTGGTGRTQLFINSNSIRYRQYQGGGNWTAWQTLSNLGNTDGKYMNIVSTPVVAQDWNSLTTVGTYNVNGATGANRPSTSDIYGTLLVQSNGHDASTLTQMFIGNNTLLFRRKTSATAWGAWKTASPTVATGAEVTAGTDNTKMVTPKSIGDSNLARTDDVNASIAQSIKDQHKELYVFGDGADISPLTTASGTTIPIGDILSKNTLTGETDAITKNSDGSITFNKEMTVIFNAGARVVVGDTNPTDYVYLDLEIGGQADKTLIAQGSTSAAGGTLKLTWSATGLQSAKVAAGSKVRIKASIRSGKQAFAVRLTSLTIQEVEGV